MADDIPERTAAPCPCCGALPADQINKTWQPIATFDPDFAWESGMRVLISGKYPNGARYCEEGHFIGHFPGQHMGQWGSRKFDPPDYWMPFPDGPED
jgi:hypothetical protein